MPAAEKFQISGIEPDLCSKYDFMFTGSSAWPTSSVVFLDEEENDDNLMQPNVIIGPAMHVEGSGDLGDEPTIVESLDEMLTGAWVDRDSLQLEEQGNDEKQKRVDESSAQSVKKGRNRPGATEEVFRKTQSFERLKGEAEKCLAQSEKFNSKKMEFEAAVYAKFLGVLNSKKRKLRELRDQLSEKEISGESAQEEEDSDKTESFDKGSDDEKSEEKPWEKLAGTSKDPPPRRGYVRKKITHK